MDEITRRDPVKVTAEDINPRYNWGRHLPVLGTMVSGGIGKTELSRNEMAPISQVA